MSRRLQYGFQPPADLFELADSIRAVVEKMVVIDEPHEELRQAARDIRAIAQRLAPLCRKGLDASLSGAGNLKIERADGTIEADVSGVGKVNVEDGRATSVEARVSGVGGVEYGGTAENLEASVSGIGGIRVDRVTGNVRKSVSGIGRVTIGD